MSLYYNKTEFLIRKLLWSEWIERWCK